MSLALAKKSLSLLENSGIKSKSANSQTGLFKRKRSKKVNKISSASSVNEDEKINQLFMLSNSNMNEEIGERVRKNLKT